MRRWIKRVLVVAVLSSLAGFSAFHALSEASEASKLPEGFPAEIPLYDGATLVRSEVKPGGMPSVLLETTDDVGTVARFYHKAMNDLGWKERPGMDTPFGGKVLSFRKEKDTLTVQITKRPEKTRVRLTTVKIK